MEVTLHASNDQQTSYSNVDFKTQTTGRMCYHHNLWHNLNEKVDVI